MSKSERRHLNPGLRALRFELGYLNLGWRAGRGMLLAEAAVTQVRLFSFVVTFVCLSPILFLQMSTCPQKSAIFYPVQSHIAATVKVLTFQIYPSKVKPPTATVLHPAEMYHHLALNGMVPGITVNQGQLHSIIHVLQN